MNNFDEKLLKNVIDEINRLNSQLEDLETYKDDFSPEEAEEIRKDTLEHLKETTKRLEKMKAGQLSIYSEVEKAEMMLNKVMFSKYKMNDLITLFLNAETNSLRNKMQFLKGQFELNQISQQEYYAAAISLLEIISKNTELNEEEKKLYDNIKKNNMSLLEEDKGINKNKLEEKITKK